MIGWNAVEGNDRVQPTLADMGITKDQSANWQTPEPAKSRQRPAEGIQPIAQGRCDSTTLRCTGKPLNQALKAAGAGSGGGGSPNYAPPVDIACLGSSNSSPSSELLAAEHRPESGRHV